MHSVLAPHATQDSPSVPHAELAVPDWQAPVASQQPFGQLAPLQATQTCSASQSSVEAVQLTQAAPPVPQIALVVPCWQLPLPSQQPSEQLFASHVQAPAAHSCPARHETQAAPFAPHSACVFPARQTVPLQQPVAQSVGSQ